MDLTQQHRKSEDAGAGEAGSIVIGWMTKLAVVAAVVGVLGFDGIAVGVGHLSTSDDASNAVQAASQNYLSTHNINSAYAAAKEVLKSTEEIKTADFTITRDGTTSLSLTNTVHTLVLHKTSQTAGWAVITAHATGKYTGS